VTYVLRVVIDVWRESGGEDHELGVVEVLPDLDHVAEDLDSGPQCTGTLPLPLPILLHLARYLHQLLGQGNTISNTKARDND
jgi:hypothetical protein